MLLKTQQGHRFDRRWVIQNDEIKIFEEQQNYKKGCKFKTQRESENNEINSFETTLESIPIESTTIKQDDRYSTHTISQKFNR